MQFNPMQAIDAYKLDHRRQYPDKTTRVYSNFTPRSSRVEGVDRVVFFGLQAFLQDYCIDQFERWFSREEADVAREYEAMTTAVLGPNDIGTEHIRALHRLGYLPLRFCALPEGTLTPLRVPMFTVENTHPDFFWLVNYIESVLSAQIWMPCTSATTAWHLRRLLDWRARETGAPAAAVDWQGHDFSLRGMASIEAAAASGAGHLLSFTGTDSIPALEYVENFYPGDNGLVGGSVAATEHSVMCAGSKEDELATFERLLDLYPSGIVSVVSDTWDLWKVLTEILPKLKDRIMARDGKLVIRPDSGNPVDIICGTKFAPQEDPWGSPNQIVTDDRTPAEKGVAELLWETFGGPVNEAGYKELDPHIGMIYGDSINYDRAQQMTERLAAKGFASTNIVLGVGSFSYQHVTRDTFGFAMKATWAEIDGEGHNLFKDPITDDGIKKSATGRLAVRAGYDKAGYYLDECASPAQESQSLLRPVWEDGQFIWSQSFASVRATLRAGTADYEAWRN
jgi:nicotinamide phosphoribosyltransferase